MTPEPGDGIRTDQPLSDIAGPQPGDGMSGDKAPAKDAKRAKRDGSATPATRALGDAGIPYALHPYHHDPATADYGAEAATKLGVDPKRVFKTLLADVDGDLVVAIVPVSHKLDLKALAAAVGGKRAAMADPARAEKTTGYRVGGISPLGQKKRLPTMIDDSCLRFASILVSAGRRGLDLEVMPQRLIDVLNARLAPIAR
jgi:Cys-tRNA(Pro)/Cys-tRNA(Cys) deacylase